MTFAAMEVPRVQMIGVKKAYGGVQAVKHADLVVKPSTVHALVGENGAGKSTLIKILCGAEHPDQGKIEIDGRAAQVSSPNDAIKAGIQTVYQEPQLFPDLSVAENLFIGEESVRGLTIDWHAQNSRVSELLAKVGLDTSVASRSVRSLSIAQQQQLSIARAVASEARVLILDEPSAILTDAEIEVLFSIIRGLVADGVSVIYISHRLDELLRIADEVTVMRDGQTIETAPISTMTVSTIAQLMIGDAPSEGHVGRAASDRGDALLAIEALSIDRHASDITLTVREREVVALYGLVGSGATEVAEAVYGMQKYRSGHIEILGRRAVMSGPGAARKRGVRMVPANRIKQGSFSFQSLEFNITIGELRNLSWGPRLLAPRSLRAVAEAMVAKLRVKATTVSQPIQSLSGGNAQKVVLARQIVQPPTVLVLAEPTQGVDIGAKDEIHRIVAGIADDGAGVLLVTSDLTEARRVADRILVVRGGRVVGEFSPEAPAVDLLRAAAGDTEPHSIDTAEGEQNH